MGKGRFTRGQLAFFQFQEGHDVVHLALTGVEAASGMGFRAEASGASSAKRADRSSTGNTRGLRDDLAVGHITIVS